MVMETQADLMNLTMAFFSFLLCLLLIDGYPSPPCNQICGDRGAKPVPYPFGFSSGCPIKLNCASNVTPAVDEFPIQSISADAITINVPASCERPLETIWGLFRRNIAPTILNGMLLLHCSKLFNNCFLPKTTVQAHFEMNNCSSQRGLNHTISCYTERNGNGSFMNLNKLMGIDCGVLFSSISAVRMENLSASGVSLGVQSFQLGWWLDGDCKCSLNGNCTKIVSPVDGKPGYRCSCPNGFVGDGYKDGLGCLEESWSCSLANYITGRCKGAARVGVLLGGITVGACLMMAAGLICCYIRKLSKKQKHRKTNQRLSKVTGITIPIYPYKEIEKATNFFCQKQRLGTGAFGTVYAGKLDEEWVAIKHLKYRGDANTIDGILNEIKLISSVNHPNLVKLMGCSIENNEQFLVYEYMPNGTLSEHLHKERKIDVFLPWPVRLDIAIDTARAIAHLHSSTDPPIFHRDIKSSNILLDFNFKCKVGDFGLSRVGLTEKSHVLTSPQGTPGYLDPQYHQNYQLSDKSDVYSFGVVLIEIITGLKAVDLSRPVQEINLATYATDRIGKGKLEEIIDPSINRSWDTWTLTSIHQLAELAFRCVTFNRDMRPSMIEVATELEQIRRGRSVNSSVPVAVSSSISNDVLWSEGGQMEERLQQPLEIEGQDVMEDIKELSPISIQDSSPSYRSSSNSSF